MEPIIVYKNRKSSYQLQSPNKLFYELPVNAIPFFRYISVKITLRFAFRTTNLVHYNLQTLHFRYSKDYSIPNIRSNHLISLLFYSDLPHKGV